MVRMVFGTQGVQEAVPSDLDLLLYARKNPTASFQQTLNAVCPALNKYKNELDKMITTFGVFDKTKSSKENWEELEQSWKASLPELLKENEESLNEREAEIAKNKEDHKEGPIAPEDNKDNNFSSEDGKEEKSVLSDDGNYILKKDEAKPEGPDALNISSEIDLPFEKDDQPERVSEAAGKNPFVYADIEYPELHTQTLEELRKMAAQITAIETARKEVKEFLKLKPDASREDSMLQRLQEANEKADILDNGITQLRKGLWKAGRYLHYAKEYPEIIPPKDQKKLLTFYQDMHKSLDQHRSLAEKLRKEKQFVNERVDELRNPVGSGQSLEEAAESFRAIQDRKLSWGRTGKHAQQFNAIKEAVQALQDQSIEKSEAERKADVYKACEAYIRSHSRDGRSIGGQGSEVGRLRKQAVVNLLQVLSKDNDVQELLAAEGKNKNVQKTKLSFADLEKSLAKKSAAKTENRYLTGAKKKAYAELNAETKAQSQPKTR